MAGSASACLTNLVVSDVPLSTGELPLLPQVWAASRFSAALPWSSNTLEAQAEAVLSGLCVLHANASRQPDRPAQQRKLLAGGEMLTAGLASTTLEKVLPNLLAALRSHMNAGDSGSDWKKQLWPKHTVAWVVHRLKHPVLDGRLLEVLPLVLPLVDDYEPDNKHIGLRCMLHIVRQTSRSELCGHALLISKVPPQAVPS